MRKQTLSPSSSSFQFSLVKKNNEFLQASLEMYKQPLIFYGGFQIIMCQAGLKAICYIISAVPWLKNLYILLIFRADRENISVFKNLSFRFLRRSGCADAKSIQLLSNLKI